MKSLSGKRRGATRVQRNRPRPSQLELIFTHTAGILLCMVWVLVSGLGQNKEGKGETFKSSFSSAKIQIQIFLHKTQAKLGWDKSGNLSSYLKFK